MGLLQSLGLKAPAGVPATTAGGTGPAPTSSVASARPSGADAAAATPPSVTSAGTPGPGAAAKPSDTLDVKLGTELAALAAVLDDINDDAVAAPLRASMQKVIDGRAAAQAMAEAKRVVALNALLASVKRQRAPAEAARKHAKAVQGRETARKDIDVTLGQVTALVLGGINDDALRKEVDAGLVKAQTDFAKAEKIADLAQGEKAFLAMKPAALALLARAEKAKAVTDWLSDTWQPLLARVKAAVAAIAAVSPRASLQAQIAAQEAEVRARTAASDLATLRGTVAPAMEQIEKAAQAITTFEKGYAEIKAQVDDAALYHGAASAFLTSTVSVAFANTKQAVDDAVARLDWAAAKAALPALKAAAAAVLKSRDERGAFHAAFDPLAADRAKVTAALAAPGLPAAAAAAYRAAYSALSNEETARNWPAALKAVPAYKAALQEALKAIKDGAQFYAIYDGFRADDMKARQLWYDTDNQSQPNEKLSAAGSHYWHYHKLLDKAVAQPDWGDAKGLLADLQIAGREFIAEAARHAAERAPYDTAFNNLNRRWEADRAAEPAVPPLAAPAAAYRKQRKLVYAAADGGDFARAIANLPLLQTMIDALMAAKDAQVNDEKAFNTGWKAIADYAEAKQAALGKTAALAAGAQAFGAADKAMEEARKVPDWTRALAVLPALQAATSELMKGKAAFNADAKPADSEAFEAKLKALEPRTSKASDATSATFVQALQKTALDRLAEIGTAMEATPRDLAAAEASYALLLADLAAMEAGKARLAAHRARFDAMKNGEIKNALAVPLLPAALGAERAAALAATESHIVAQASSGDTAGADAKLAAWALEAKGWQETQKAYAELHGGKVPSADVLAALAGKPGGDQALDDLIMKMPPTTPANVLGAALKARFGFEVKRLDAMNADIQNLKGLAAHDPKQPDPELVAMYKLLSQIPSKRIKGKISELVDFDANDGGGVYYGGGEKKIYTHAGQIGDSSNEKTFGKEGEVMPKGEEVEDDCKPAPKAPKMPQADHTLLHEAAHAEDDGIKFMDGRWEKPEFGGWRKESPESIAKVAAAHLQYDRDWIQKVLEDAGSKPPTDTPKAPKGVKPDEWERRRQAALVWCESIRSDNNPWWKGAVCQRIAIGGRVYQEAYPDGRWRSYLYSARARGISGYQFRAPAEWFAELYAAYFGEKLKPSHPAMSWLVQFKPQKPA